MTIGQTTPLPVGLAQLRKDLDEFEKLEKKKKYNAIKFYSPYPKQKEFHSVVAKERLLLAGNQLGKTYAGAMEAAYHLTGEYPAWWRGRRWDRPVKCWVGGVTGLAVRDTCQKLLLGEPQVEVSLGSGSIPRDRIIHTSLARGVSGLLDTVQVKHKSGGASIMKFKTYDQGREKWQGDTLDFIWFDEEPDLELYTEGLTRTAATGGMVFMTFTPLKGRSEVVKQFLNEPTDARVTVKMTARDAAHMTPEKIKENLAMWPAWQHDARLNGVPLQGEGAIFQIPESMITIPHPVPLPPHWVYIWGVDFGGVSDSAHPFAAALLGWDRDSDCLTICHTIRMKNARPLDHAVAMKGFGVIPVAWPQDGTARESNGVQLKEAYVKAGLPMLQAHATFPKGGYSTEAGIQEMNERMTTNRWKVTANNPMWLEEFRHYHREDGLIVKIDDDLLSASRIGMMMRRYAKYLQSAWPYNREAKKELTYDTSFPI